MSRGGPGIAEVWGTGGGPLRHLAPEVRLVLGALMLTSCVAAAPATPAGVAFVTVTAVGWAMLGGAPLRLLGRSTLLGLLMLAPLLALTPWVEAAPDPHAGAAPGWLDSRWVVTGSVVVKGVAGVVVSMVTLTTLSRWDLHEGLARIPMPRLLRALIGQLVHQAGLLADETRRIAAAMAVRGAARRWRRSLAMLTALPKVWLPRVLDRADRSAAAMELRGLDLEPIRFRTIRRTWRDGVGLALGAAWLVVAISCRGELVR